MMHLLLTSTRDVTSDLIVEKLADQVLRVNLERWSEYRVEITETGFRIADDFGRAVTDGNLGNIIWRKPQPDIAPHPGEAWYCFHEFKYAIEAIMERVRQMTPAKLPIDPVRNAVANKIKQLDVARKYMRTPRWCFTSVPSEHMWRDRSWCVKSMTGRPIPGSTHFSPVMYTQPIKPAELADRYPWFIQESVDAKFDLTVVFVDGNQFGFLLDRSLFSGLDWRRSIGRTEVDHGWRRVNLPVALSAAITGIMADLDLKFGRLDFLAADANCNDVTFLEVNPNGQWAWLDPQRDNGLFRTVLDFLTGVC